MNAYELADELAKYDWYYEETFVGEDGYTQERQVCWTSLTEESAAMLRQQADRIAELEKDLHIIERHYDQLGKDVSSKPVAWMSPTRNNFVSKSTPSYAKRGTDNWIPLYTHPVKELTDEELDSIIASIPYPRTHAMDKHMIKLALKKASEK